jgi:hypothetical protein
MRADRRIITGAIITLICGAVIIASTFMPWMGFSEEGYSAYGSAWEHIDVIIETEHSWLDYFVDRGFGNMIFTGIIFVIVGIFIILVSTILLFRRRMAVATTLLFLSLIAAFISVANIVSMSNSGIHGSDTTMLVGIGLYISLAFSILGVVGYFIVYSWIRGSIINEPKTSEPF